MLEGLHALLAAAVLHSLAGVSKGKGAILKGQGHHSPTPHRLGQGGPGQVNHPTHPLAGGHSHRPLQGNPTPCDCMADAYLGSDAARVLLHVLQRVYSTN